MNKKNLPKLNKAALLRRIRGDLKSIDKSCDEAIDGRWDKSDDGFEDIQTVLGQVLDDLRELSRITVAN